MDLICWAYNPEKKQVVIYQKLPHISLDFPSIFFAKIDFTLEVDFPQNF